MGWRPNDPATRLPVRRAARSLGRLSLPRRGAHLLASANRQAFLRAHQEPMLAPHIVRARSRIECGVRKRHLGCLPFSERPSEVAPSHLPLDGSFVDAAESAYCTARGALSIDNYVRGRLLKLFALRHVMLASRKQKANARPKAYYSQ